MRAGCVKRASIAVGVAGDLGLLRLQELTEGSDRHYIRAEVKRLKLKSGPRWGSIPSNRPSGQGGCSKYHLNRSQDANAELPRRLLVSSGVVQIAREPHHELDRANHGRRPLFSRRTALSYDLFGTWGR